MLTPTELRYRNEDIVNIRKILFTDVYWEKNILQKFVIFNLNNLSVVLSMIWDLITSIVLLQ